MWEEGVRIYGTPRVYNNFPSYCILAKKKKLFYHQRTNKTCVIGEAKAKFFATIVNWYKYQLTVQVVKNKI